MDRTAQHSLIAARKGWRISGSGIHSSTWLGVVSSRLGRPVERRQGWFRLLEKVMQQALSIEGAIVLAKGTASEPWVRRDSWLFRVPMIEVANVPKGEEDACLVELCDQIFALRVRKQGKIFRLLQDQLVRGRSSIRVGIWDEPDDAGAELVKLGATGWYVIPNGRSDDPIANGPVEAIARNSMPSESGHWWSGAESGCRAEWLVHCTRGRSGPYPWQSREAWRDAVLLGADDGWSHGSGEVLQQIVQTMCLRSAALSQRTRPVVCFSACPLNELLCQRIYRPHRSRWDYEPFGVAIRKEVVLQLGGEPVVYAASLPESGLPQDDPWRFQPIGKTYDWTMEREWRVPGSIDLRKLRVDDLFVFAGNKSWVKRLQEISCWPVINAPVNAYNQSKSGIAQVKSRRPPYLVEPYVESGYRTRCTSSVEALQDAGKSRTATAHRGCASRVGQSSAYFGSSLSARRSYCAL